MDDSNTVVIDNFDLDEEEDDALGDSMDSNMTSSSSSPSIDNSASKTNNSVTNVSNLELSTMSNNHSSPLLEWKNHRNRLSTRLGITLQKSPKNENEEEIDGSMSNSNEDNTGAVAPLLASSSNTSLADHDSMEDVPIDISFSSSHHTILPEKNHFQLLARNHELEDALDTSHEHIEMLSQQLSSTSNSNKASNHIIVKLKEQYQQLEGKLKSNTIYVIHY